VTTLVVEHPPGREAERAYAIGVVLREFLGLDYVATPGERADVRISRADGTPGALRVSDVLFAVDERDWLQAKSLPSPPLPQLDMAGLRVDPRLTASSLPVLFGAAPAGDGEWLTRHPEGLSLAVDVFGSALFMLARYEELVVTERDPHGRFPAAASIGAREGFLERPIVDEYVELLWSALKALWPRLERPRREFRLLPSHDVDWPREPHRRPAAFMRTLAGDLLRRRDPLLALDRARAVRGDARDLYDTFGFLMDQSEAAGVRSAFYFQAGSTNSNLDGGYELEDPWLSTLIGRIHERGHEVGLHPTYETFKSAAAIGQEFGALRQACARIGVEQSRWGGRQHFLRWENPVTWRAWEEAGLDYDSTLGFAEQAGFRAGTCREYPTFDLLGRRALSLRERPLVVMEASLFDYARLSRDDARATVERLRERCQLLSGDFTLLWHNSRLQSQRDRRLYRSLVGT
jgi:hypothetical protein